VNFEGFLANVVDDTCEIEMHMEERNKAMFGNFIIEFTNMGTFQNK